MNSKFSHIPQYESDIDSEILNEINVHNDLEKRKKYKSYKLFKDVVFNNQEEALKHIQKEYVLMELLFYELHNRRQKCLLSMQ